MAYRIRDWKKHFEVASSRKLKRLDWVALPVKLDGEGYTYLVDHQNGAAHYGAWVAMMGIAAKQKERGALPEGTGGLSATLARISRIPLSVFNEVIPRLLELEWIEKYELSPLDFSNLADVGGSSGDVGGLLAGVGGKVAAHNITLHNTDNPLRSADAEQEETLFELVTSEQKGKRWFNASFERWWESYWNKTAKVKARAAYEKRVKILVSKGRTHEQAEEFLIAAAIDDRSRFELTDAWGWRVNLNPPTWLNQERWNDQAPDAVAAKPTKGAECAWGRNGRCGRMAVSRGLCKEHLAVWESECAEEQTCR